MKGILVDDDGNIMVRNASLAIGDISVQCAKLLLFSYKGELKNAPNLGGGVKDFIGGSYNPCWRTSMKRELIQNLTPVKDIKLGREEIIIDIIE